MALAVVALWACIGMEAVTRRQAEQEARLSLFRIRNLRRSSQPAAIPLRIVGPPRVTAS
jgi:hypothetical protein